jgi:hypothetical protein
VFQCRTIQSSGRISLGVWVSLCLAAATTEARQPSGTLDLYSPAETPEDDLQLSRASDFGHLRLGAQLHLDYANNPLMWEDALGDSSSERYSVVRHQVVSTVGLSLGLADRVVLYAGLPTTLWMAGESAAALAPMDLAAADSAGLGEGYLGGRVRAWGERDDTWAFAGQLTLQLPTGAYGDQAYRSRETVSVHPELIGEVRPHPHARMVVNLGTHLRQNDASGPTNLAYGPDLSFGLGGVVRAWTASSDAATHLDVHLQLQGATQWDRFLDREHSPLEALAGPKFFHGSGLSAAVAAGAGLSRGMGSPDIRLIGMVGYAVPETSTQIEKEPRATHEGQ